MTKRWWEDEFKDFYWEQGKYADRQLGIHGYIEFIKNIEDKATTAIVNKFGRVKE